jgi:hypothetical protein
MKGWVYVMSNRAMPGLLKVGFSSKDPDLRAEDLNHPGSPHPYVVDYEVLVEDPYRLEQRVHGALAHYSEAKEWFRCEAEVAVAAIREAAAGQIIHETFKRADRQRALAIQKQREEQEARGRQASARKSEIRKQYAEELALHLPNNPFWQYWLGCAMAIAIAIVLVATKPSDAQVFWWSTIFGALAAHFVKEWHINRAKESESYKALLAERDRELAQCND